jgi:hypothetical protein
MMRTKVLLTGLLILAVSPAFALNVNGGTGAITDWGVTPFVGAWGNPGIRYIEQNDYSPISFPNSGNFPSPGGAEGEKYDMEFMGVRQTNGTLQVLGITSFGEGGVYSASHNYTFLPGDIFLDEDCDGIFEYAIVTYDHDGFTAGNLYSVGTTYGIDSAHGGWGGVQYIRDAADPLGLATGNLVASGNRDMASFDYNSTAGLVTPWNEDDTWLWEFNVDISQLDINLDNTCFHWTLECGNDVLEVPRVVPEPATIVLLSGGLAGLSMLRRRKRSKA